MLDFTMIGMFAYLSIIAIIEYKKWKHKNK